MTLLQRRPALSGAGGPIATAAPVVAAPSGLRRVMGRDKFPAILVATATIAVLVVAVLLAVALWLSFVDGSPGDPELGYTLANYRDIFLSPFTYHVVVNTFAFSAITLIVAMGFGLPIAWLIERTDFPAKRLVFTLFAVALLIPGFSVALGWLFLLNPRIGLLNEAIESLFGLKSAPLDISTIFGMGIVQGLSLAPVAFIMTAIVFRSMDSALDDAARVGGAGAWAALRQVTAPLAWPGVLAAGIYIFTIGFGAFDVPAILGLSNRVFTFSTYVFLQVGPTYGEPQYGDVAALSVFMLALAAVFSWWYARMQRQAPRFAVVTGKGYRPTLIRLGSLRCYAIGLVVFYFALSQLLPVLTLIWSAGLPYLQPVSRAAIASLSFGNFRSLPHGLVVEGIGNTVALMFLVPTVTLIVSIAVSWVVLRSHVRFRGLFDFFAFLPHAVPKLVFSVAAWLLALFVLRTIIPIYGTIWILVIVYVVAMLSYGTRMINSALIQLHKELEESATVSGASLAETMRSVVIPLLTPTIMYAWIWIALLAYRELTIPVILATNDNQPLSVVVWSLVYSSSYGEGSAVAVAMLVLMVPIVALYWAIARRTGVATTA